VQRLICTNAFYYDGTNVDELFAYINSLTDDFDIKTIICIETIQIIIDENELSTVELSIGWDNGEDTMQFMPTIYPDSFLVEAQYNLDQPFIVYQPVDFYRNYAEYDPKNKYNYTGQ